MVVLVASMRSWSEMPVLAQIMVAVLTPLFLIVAIHPKGWAQLSTVPFLYADQSGMYFPSNNPRVLGKKYECRWLFVPWANISNLRVASVMTSEGKQSCAAMDVVASKEEVNEFFCESLQGEQFVEPGFVAVAFYCNIPPRAKTVVARLKTIDAQDP